MQGLPNVNYKELEDQLSPSEIHVFCYDYYGPYLLISLALRWSTFLSFGKKEQDVVILWLCIKCRRLCPGKCISGISHNSISSSVSSYDIHTMSQTLPLESARRVSHATKSQAWCHLIIYAYNVTDSAPGKCTLGISRNSISSLVSSYDLCI